MKVLVISHTVFSDTESMGKTLSAYFRSFAPDDLAQLYIHSQIPASRICGNYYQITDLAAIKSIFGFRCGRIYGMPVEDCGKSASAPQKPGSVVSYIYQKGRKRTALIYLMRNLWWRLSHWNNSRLREWIDKFSPDCVFFASGDYAFMYDIACKIAETRNIPLYISCVDDYYIHNKNTSSVLGRMYYGYFMKRVNAAMRRSEKLFCICDKMSQDYSQLFGKECITVHTPASFAKAPDMGKKNWICYLGSLGYKRDRQLIKIGRALKHLNLGCDHIDVYTPESRQEILCNLTGENGIRVHGPVGAEEVVKIISQSFAVIHAESFDSVVRRSICYSVSTKIADSLASGTCIFAFGPPEIASMQYLAQNEAAVCCTDENALEESLKTLLTDEKKRAQVISNALSLARNNHMPDITPKTISSVLNRDFGNSRERESFPGKKAGGPAKRA